MKKLIILTITHLFYTGIQAQRSIDFTDISIIEISPNGNVWVGSVAGGCAAYFAATQQWSGFTTANSSMRSDSVTAISLYTINGVAHSFMGSKNGIGFRYGNNNWDTIPDLVSRSITDIVRSQASNQLFVATNEGISYYNDTSLLYQGDITTANSTIPSNKITCFNSKPLTCAGFYAGTADTGYFFTTDGVNFTHKTTGNSNLIDNRVNCIYVNNDCSGDVLAGTKGGLSVCNSSTCTNFTTQNGLPENDVTALEKDCKGNIWIGTANNGIAIYNGSTFQYITTTNGLSSNRIADIKCKSDCECWIGTVDGGLTVLDSSLNVQNIINSISNIIPGGFVVYPQPATDNLVIPVNELNKHTTLKVYDLTGKELAVEPKYTDTRVEFSVTHLAAGTYIYALQQGNNATKGKFVVSK